jgi:hypothetical protein
LLLTILPIGRTLSRGQSNTIVLLFLCGLAAFIIRGRRFAAGVSLAGAICVKIFPAFLLLYPLARRDLRCLLGVAAGLVIGLAVIPASVLGPSATLAAYQRLGSAVLQPALGVTIDDARRTELLNPIGSVSFMSVMRNVMYPREGSEPQPITRGIRVAHWSLSAAFTAATLWCGLRRRREDPISELLFLGALTVVMLPALPTCFVPYFIFAIPLVVGLVADAWEQHGFAQLGLGLTLLFALAISADLLASSLPPIPRLGLSLRELGVPLFAALAVWAAGLRALQRRAREAIAV